MVLPHGLLRDMAAVVEHRDGEIEGLQTNLKQLLWTQSAVVPSASIPISSLSLED